MTSPQVTAILGIIFDGAIPVERLDAIPQIKADIQDLIRTAQGEFAPKKGSRLFPVQPTAESDQLTKKIVEMRDVQGLTYEKIAETLSNEGVTGRFGRSITTDACRHRYGQAKRKLRDSGILNYYVDEAVKALDEDEVDEENEEEVITAPDITQAIKSACDDVKKVVETIAPPQPIKHPPSKGSVNNLQADEELEQMKSDGCFNLEIAQYLSRKYNGAWTAADVGKRYQELLKIKRAKK